MDINELMIPVKNTRLREGDAPAPSGEQAPQFNSQAFSSAYKSLITAERTARQVVQRTNKANPKLKLQVPPASMDPSTKRKILLGVAIVGALMVGQKIKMMNLKKAADIAAKEDATPEEVAGAVTGQPVQPLGGNNTTVPTGDGATDANATGANPTDANSGADTTANGGATADATTIGTGTSDQGTSAQGSDQSSGVDASGTSTGTETQGTNASATGGQGGYQGTVANSNEAIANAKPGDTIQRNDGTVVTLNQGDIDYAKGMTSEPTVENSNAAVANAKPGDTIRRNDGTMVTLNQGDIDYAKNQANGGQAQVSNTGASSGATDTGSGDVPKGGIEDVAQQTQQVVSGGNETDPWKKKAAEMRANGVTSYNGMSPDVVEKMSDPAFRQKMADEVSKQAQSSSASSSNASAESSTPVGANATVANNAPVYTDKQIDSFARDAKKTVDQGYRANRGAINDTYNDAKSKADAERDAKIAQNNATLKGRDRTLANRQANLDYANARNDAQKGRNAARTANRDARKQAKGAINDVASEMKANNNINNPVMNGAVNNAVNAQNAQATQTTSTPQPKVI